MSLYNKIIDLQKLSQAWSEARKNHPAAGVDNVTFEEFEERKAEGIRQLHQELREHRYRALPVKRVILYKGEKAREIALYAMRDKVVQRSLEAELKRIYEGQFSPQAFAYRSSKSALNAVNEIDQRIKSGKYSWALRLDISGFFDSIQWEKLEGMLKKNIKDEDVLFLIEENCKSVMLDEGGGLVEKKTGIYQGSAVSPTLSNIYMMDFDDEMTKGAAYYVRYSDDMLFLGNSREELLEECVKVKAGLSRLGLCLNEGKTVCAPLEKGVDFLGYHFGMTGMAIPAKAERNLEERLETMWLTSSEKTIEEKLKNALEIVGGWEQYFHGEREVHSIFEYIVLMQFSGKKKEGLADQRREFSNYCKDIAVYLAKIWKEEGEEALELLEYEQFYQIWTLQGSGQKAHDNLKELLDLYRSYIIQENADTTLELMQLYTDRGEYQKAAFWQKQRESLEKKAYGTGSHVMLPDGGETSISFDRSSAEKVLNLFVGREDIYSSEEIGSGGKRQNEIQAYPLTAQKLYEHLCGKVTLGTYVQRSNGTVRYIVTDIDVSKKVLLQSERGSAEYRAYLEKALQKANEVLELYREFGMAGYIEYSGGRGYHVWLIMTQWIPVRYANMFCDVVERRLGRTEEGIGIEFFPNKTRLKPGKFGQTIKLPWGFHMRTGERSYFIDESGNRVTNVNLFLDSLAKNSLGALKKVLAVNLKENDNTGEKKIETDLSAYQDTPENVLEVLKGCSLMGYLCNKAAKTGYLTHFERLSVLYVFGHLGEDGKQFVHTVMAHTLNYQYNMTERFIRRIPEKPVSCVKLREQYKQITAECGCNCDFKRSKNCYPSPVLHAILLSNDLQKDVTIPTSRTITNEKEKKIVEELNVHKKAQELAEKILELKKQKRSIDASVLKIEKELEKLFDLVRADCLEIELGMLVRRKKETGYEWLIEI